MLLQTRGSNAEYVRRVEVSTDIIRIAIPNQRRNAGLIINRSTSDCLIEFGDYPDRLLDNPSYALLVPKNGGNLDIPPDYIGAIWARWLNTSAVGYLNIHHYYLKS